MHYHRIPHSSLEISQLGLGTMTFGEQNSEADAHAQLDYAVSQGINLIDVAEMNLFLHARKRRGLPKPTSATGWQNAVIAKNWLSPRKSAALRVTAMPGSAQTRPSIARISVPRWMPA